MRTITMIVILCMTLSMHGQNRITGMEFWFDQQHTSRQFLSLPATNEFIKTIQNLTVGQVMPGYHTLNLRLRDTEGIWSSVMSQRVFIHPQPDNKISSLRIWSDPTSNPSDLFVLPINPEVKYLYITQVLDLCQLDNTGSTRVFFQLGDNNGNWSSVTSKILNVDVVGEPPATIGDIIGAEFVCFNTNQNYNVNHVQGASDYHWDVPVTWQPATSFDTLSIIPDHVDGLISVYASNACGNSDTVSFAISINDSMPMVPIVTEGPTSVCTGVEYHYAVTSNEDVNEYLWTFPQGWASSFISDTERTVIPGIISGDITVSASNACGTSIVTLGVNVALLEVPIISGPSDFCEGDSITLTSSPAYSYLWSNGDTTQNIIVNSPGNYKVTITNSSGCTAVSIEKTIIVNPLPIASISTNGATTFCNGGSVVLTASDASSYLWSNGESTQNISVSSSGSYTVTLTNANGCLAISPAITVTVNPLPIIDLGDDITLSPGQDTILNASGTGLTYSWSTNETTPTITVNTGGTYTVTVTDGNGCKSSDTIVITFTTSARDLIDKFAITVSPNPTDGMLLISCQGGSSSIVQIIDIQGKVVIENIALVSEGEIRSLSIENLPSGTYFVRLIGESFVGMISIIKL